VTALQRPDVAEGEPGTRHAQSPPDCPTILYIAGSGRSGSTLLERTLGELPSFVNVGELIDARRRTVARGERCGCGQAFVDCPFWARVGARSFGGWAGEGFAAVHQLQLRVARQRHIPSLLAMPLADRSFQQDVASYGASYARLYRTIANEVGAACVVDASKWPVQALALYRAGLDIRVIHLVRDVRGVAHSLGKRDVARPHALQESDVMAHTAPAAAAARWVACQGEAELLRCCGVPVTRVRYEDFVGRPRPTVLAALNVLGLSPDPAHLAHIGDGRIVLGVSHGLSGNPSRFRDGVITLQSDEAWRAAMPRRDRAVVTAIGLPLLLRYGMGRRKVRGLVGSDR